MLSKMGHRGKLFLIIWLTLFTGISTVDYFSVQDNWALEITESGDLEEPDTEENNANDYNADKFFSSISNFRVVTYKKINRFDADHRKYLVSLVTLGPPPESI